jgi:ISXO2 transposase-like protein
LLPIIRSNIQAETTIMTDEAAWDRGLRHHFASHEAVNHTLKAYVRGAISTNTVGGYFSRRI